MLYSKAVYLNALILSALLFPLKTTAEPLTSTALFDGPSPSWLSLTPGAKFNVFISDEIKNQCWTKSNSAKTAVTLELQRSGFEVVDKGYDFYLEIYGLGSAIFNKGGSRLGCAGMWKVDIGRSFGTQISFESADWPEAGHEIKKLTYGTLYSTWGTQSSSDTLDDINDSFVEAVQTFLTMIPQRKQEILEAVQESKYANDEAKAFWKNWDARNGKALKN